MVAVILILLQVQNQQFSQVLDPYKASFLVSYPYEKNLGNVERKNSNWALCLNIFDFSTKYNWASLLELGMWTWGEKSIFIILKLMEVGTLLSKFDKEVYTVYEAT